MKLTLAVSLIITVLIFSNLTKTHANALAEYVTSPHHDWKYEKIPFPFEFAPTIPLEGVEELLFAPGMYDITSTSFFSYAFVWHFKGEKLLTEQQITQYFDDYYRGLYKALSKSDAGDTLTVKLSDSQNGVINWTEPFVSKKPQQLHFEYKQLKCSSQQSLVLFAKVSPHPTTHEIWHELKQIKLKNC